jgi:hypothetical protein
MERGRWIKVMSVRSDGVLPVFVCYPCWPAWETAEHLRRASILDLEGFGALAERLPHALLDWTEVGDVHAALTWPIPFEEERRASIQQAKKKRPTHRGGK